ncbi:flagellar motor protein [uncultured Azohydromonas sp.]|jgi:Flagellar motor component|uniref:flagellar motor protein n=1 Tax=uncultured Azohydromonas sp. TaxID=487342 RepID=UPI0026061F7B|nr:flagellar motor protein [uncultured Azohydromonas sp.]
MDFLTLAGAVLALAAIGAGFALDGGQLGVLLQAQALLIVVGGTLGAVMIQNTWGRFLDGIKQLRWAFSTPKPVDREDLTRLLEWGRKAKVEGILGLESVNTEGLGGFAARGMELLANGVPSVVIDDALRRELDAYERNQMAAAKIWHQAGGYSPTFGIVGAVLGLIQITSHISEPTELGKGIAVAFVATLYGVGLANLVYLPLYGKIKAQIDNQLRYRKLYLDGIMAIARKETPKTIETRLVADIRQRADEVLN